MSQTMVDKEGREIVVIHLATFPQPTQERLACMPHMTLLSASDLRTVPYHRTGDVRAVTCPLCRQMPVFGDAVKVQTSTARRAT